MQPEQIEDQISAIDEFIQQECFCCLCGSELEFQHEFDFLNLKVSEKSSCRQCHIDISNKDHTLH